MKRILMRRWVTLGAAWLIGFFGQAAVLCVSPILGMILQDFSLSHTQAGLLFSMPVAMVAVFSIPAGILSDRIGVRKTAGIGAILITAGGSLRGASPDFVTLLAFTCIVGVGFGAIMASLPKIASSLFPEEFSGTATGVYITGLVGGAASSIAITLPLVHAITNTWQGVFYLWGILMLIVTVVWWILVRDPTVGEVPKHASKKPGVKIGAAWRNKYVWITAALLFVGNNSIFYAVTGWFPSFFVTLSVTSAEAALITSLAVFAEIPAILFIPVATDRLGLRKPFYLVSALAAAAIIYAFLHIPVSFSSILMVLLGITFATTFSLPLILVVDLVDTRFVGSATGIVLSIGYAGGIFGPWMGGYIIDVTGGFVLMLAMLIVLSLVSAGLYFFGIPETGLRARKRPEKFR